MKIGIVCPYDMFRSGGVQEHVRAQATELRERGHNVKIITPRPRKFTQATPQDVLFIGNSTMIRTPISTSLELGISMERNAVDDMLGQENFDVLHVHEPEVPLLGAQIIAKASCPVIATFHAIHPDNPVGKTIETLRIPYSRSLFSRLSKITAVSEVAAAFVSEQTDTPVTIIPNGINLKTYTTKGKKQQRKPETILYIGRLEKRKGVKYLIQAFAELQKQRPTVRLIVAGDGPDRAKLEELVTQLRLKHVRFLGFIEETDKLELLATTQLFCSPALYGESFGIVLLEAMAMGAVTVAGNNPGYASVMKATGQLSLVNCRDVKEFSRRLEMLLYDEGLRKTWLAWAKRYVTQFSYENIVDEYEKIYRQLVVS